MILENLGLNKFSLDNILHEKFSFSFDISHNQVSNQFKKEVLLTYE